MGEDKREGDKPVPGDVNNYLNDAQLVALRKIEGFGWKLKFIRRPLFQEHVIVITNADDGAIGILCDDGRVDLEPNIETRE